MWLLKTASANISMSMAYTSSVFHIQFLFTIMQDQISLFTIYLSFLTY